MDQSKKTMRHFYCRDVLWETFEQMANDFDCSIDYLINESMRYYARSKNYPSAGAQQGGQGLPPAGPPQHPTAPGPGGPTAPRRPPPLAPVAAPVPVQAPPSAPPQRRPAPPVPGLDRPAAPMQGVQPPPSQPGMGRAGYAAPPPSPSYPGPQAPQAPHAQAERAAAPVGAGQQLFLVFSGQRYPVGKDQFIIGRGSKTSDLPIKDGNISRKHAAVIRRNGTFYIKDLGSTNGIEYKGMRIDNKRIDEGDVFHLCDYELRFTYRAD